MEGTPLLSKLQNIAHCLSSSTSLIQRNLSSNFQILVSDNRKFMMGDIIADNAVHVLDEHRDLLDLGTGLIRDGPVKQETTPRRIRGLYNGVWIFDTLGAVYVWEKPYYPYFYIPIKEFRDGVLSHADGGTGPARKALEGVEKTKGFFYLGKLSVGGQSTERVLLFHGETKLSGLVRIEHAAITWFAEDEKLLGPHPKDPYKRVETFPSSRTIRIEVDGVVVAESSQNVFLYETMLRPRYYLNPGDVKYEFLTESETTSFCPYKGMANYYNIVIKGKEIKDAVWYYKYPTSESALVQSRLCFYNEKVDVFIDGVAEEKYCSPLVLPKE